jgi:hypothetical protein
LKDLAVHSRLQHNRGQDEDERGPHGVLHCIRLQ